MLHSLPTSLSIPGLVGYAVGISDIFPVLGPEMRR